MTPVFEVCNNNKLIVYFDGLCEPRNPGGVACYGWIITSHDGISRHTGRGLYSTGGPESTNNRAEYAGLWSALKWLADTKWHGELILCGDSKLVVMQLAKECQWRCNAKCLIKARNACLELLGKITPNMGYSVRWIPREQNHEADELSRQAYFDIVGKMPPERHKQYA